MTGRAGGAATIQGPYGWAVDGYVLVAAETGAPSGVAVDGPDVVIADPYSSRTREVYG
jgi:hypothetical protein